LVLRLLKKLTDPVIFGRETLDKGIKLNQAVTASHICLIISYTVISLLRYNVPRTDGA
jgi:hypothetical protein